MAEKKNISVEVSRHELKYFIDPVQGVMLTQALRNVLLEDKHNGPDGYRIRSLYFDTYAETDFYQKMDGFEDRKKLRLRTYGADASSVKLEIKRKYGNEQIKKSSIISREDAKRLIDCDYEVLRDYDNKTTQMQYELMHINHVRPVVLIEYKRMAFIHPTNNIRITLDTDIRSSETCFDLFAAEPVLTPVNEFGFFLVEVKYDSFIMRWLSEILARYEPVGGAYSKYIKSRGIFERYLS